MKLAIFSDIDGEIIPASFKMIKVKAMKTDNMEMCFYK